MKDHVKSIERVSRITNLIKTFSKLIDRILKKVGGGGNKKNSQMEIFKVTNTLFFREYFKILFLHYEDFEQNLNINYSILFNLQVY